MILVYLYLMSFPTVFLLTFYFKTLFFKNQQEVLLFESSQASATPAITYVR